MRMIRTTKGVVEESTLARTVIFQDHPNEFTIAVEYRLGDELVRRDAHIVMKEPSVIADAVAASLK